MSVEIREQRDCTTLVESVFASDYLKFLVIIERSLCHAIFFMVYRVGWLNYYERL
jgi:hypothetical protein